MNTAIARKPKAATHWTVRELPAGIGIGKSTVQRYLALFGASQPQLQVLHRPSVHQEAA